MDEDHAQDAQVAKDRLNQVLVQDRTGLSGRALNALRQDLLALLSSHLEIETAALELNLEVAGREQRLRAVISLPAVRRRKIGPER